MRFLGLSLAAALLACSGIAGAAPNTISGQYLEVRTCDVYTGPCFANGEMGLDGKEAILTWSVDRGAWQGVELDGLKVIAALKAEGTLDDLRRDIGSPEAVIIVDAAANNEQKQALVDFAKAMAGDLIGHVAAVESAPIETRLGACDKNGCGYVKAEGLVEISTRCLNDKDHVCGNEETFYPPLTDVKHATPAYTKIARYDGDALGLKWKDVGSRGAFLATFSA